MQKISTMRMSGKNIFEGQLTIGVDLGAKETYPETALLKQVNGVGDLIALTYVLTIEDPYRFPKSREVGCFLGLRPGRRNSGQSEPQKHISKEGDEYLRALMVQGAHYILGPFGTEARRARRKKRQETSGGHGGTKVSDTAASVVGKWRGVRTLRNSQKVMREVA